MTSRIDIHLGQRRKQNRLKIASVDSSFQEREENIIDGRKQNRKQLQLMRVVFREEKKKKKIENDLC